MMPTPTSPGGQDGLMLCFSQSISFGTGGHTLIRYSFVTEVPGKHMISLTFVSLYAAYRTE
jgi:hypothetical protein